MMVMAMRVRDCLVKEIRNIIKVKDDTGQRHEANNVRYDCQEKGNGYRGKDHNAITMDSDGISSYKIINHFHTVCQHKYLVAKGCFAVGLYKQGLLHDLSKFSATEFLVGARYWQGYRSPNNAEREAIGYSSSWLHHKGRNRHHYEYWIDYSEVMDNPLGMAPSPMPEKYILEMFMDRIAASKVYNGKKYKDRDSWDYYKKGAGRVEYYLHPQTRALLEKLLKMLAVKGEKYTFSYIRRNRGHLLDKRLRKL